MTKCLLEWGVISYSYSYSLCCFQTFTQTECLSPIMSVLIECARNHRILRKFLRLQILPPLKDTHRRPEEGNTIRNRLCKFLTSPYTQIKDLVAELLFILCKENGLFILHCSI